MPQKKTWITVLALLGFLAGAPARATDAAPDAEQGANDPINVTLSQINNGFKNVKVRIVTWPKELQKQLGKLKDTAFMAVPRKPPTQKPPTAKLPLLIALHGGGGKQMSLDKQLERSARVKGLALAELAGKNLILLEPNSSDNWDPDTLDTLLDHVLERYPEIDKTRVYVMGHSMGGSGTWNWVLQSPDRFAAAAPCGFGGPAETDNVERLAHLPVWGMVGGDDGNNVIGVQKMVDKLRATGNVNVRHTAFPGANHSAGNAAVFGNVEWIEWMLTFSRSQ